MVQRLKPQLNIKMRVVLVILCLSVLLTTAWTGPSTSTIKCDSPQCLSKIQCGLSMSCDDGKCYDPCEGFCGENTTCRVFRHHPFCTCKRGYEGDPLLGCAQGVGCSKNEQCADSSACVLGACVDPCRGACDEDLTCQVQTHTATCIQPTSIHQLHTRSDENYEYKFLPISSGSRIKFKVKAKNDAHIMLAQTSNPTGSDLYYEMVVGGWSNTASAIRKDRNVDPKVKVSTDKIISESEFRGFWVEYSRGIVAVGREQEETPFMSWADPQPLDVKYVGFATGFDADGWWLVYEEGCTESKGCAEDRVCSSGVCVNSCRVKPRNCEDDEYFCQVQSHVPSCSKPGNIQRLRTSIVEFDYTYFTAPAKGSVIKFKVKANNDAHFILTESPRPNVTTDNFIEIVIGGWSNTYSVIRNKRENGDKDKEYYPGILRNDQYRGFWVQYLDGKISVGRENEINPFLMWTDSKVLNFKYYGVATGFGSDGEWIMYKPFITLSQQ